MIRLTLLLVYILGFSAYAWRNWFVSLCALMILNPVNGHPDMPKGLFGVPGLNPWNFLLVNVVLAWIVNRHKHKGRFDPPAGLALLSVVYFAVLLIAWIRMYSDRTGIEMVSSTDLINDVLINSIKWVIPGILLFDGARTHERLKLAVLTICGIYVLYGIQVLKWMPPWVILDAEGLQHRAIKLIEKEMGYSRVNMSMMLAGGSWALLCAREAFRKKWVRWLAFSLFLMTGLAQALTGGRMGYVTWGLIGIMLSFLRWRRYLVVGPIFVMIIVGFVPAVRERALQGITGSDVSGDQMEVNTAEMTSDRTLIWPAVIDKIETGPLVGFGLAAMKRTGLTDEFEHLAFPHPHNAYLEVLLDAGVVGLIPVLGFFLVVMFYSSRLFIFPRSALERAVGGIGFSLTLALLIASFGSQHFLPQEGGVGMWCAIGLVARLTADRARARATARRRVPMPVAAPQPASPRVAAR